MVQVFGTFILSNEKNQYQAEYFNNHSTEFIDENIRIVNSPNLFQGTFQTEWTEKGQKYLADLTITTNGSVFNLNWTNVRKGDESRSATTFEGKGVIKGGKLVAVYRMK
jgi:hemin uptake protein HemP